MESSNLETQMWTKFIWTIDILADSYILLRRILKDKIWNDITKKTNEWGWKQKEREKGDAVIQPGILALYMEKVENQVKKNITFLKIVEFVWKEWRMRETNGTLEAICYWKRDEGGRDECPCHQGSNIIHLRPSDLKIEEKQVLEEEHAVRDGIPTRACKLQLPH